MEHTQTWPLSTLSFLLPIGFVGLLALAVSIWMIWQEKKTDWTNKQNFKLLWDVYTAGFIIIAMYCSYLLLDWYWLNPKMLCQHFPREYLSH